MPSLQQRNADACEQAKEPRCRCACGGKMHGIKHPEEWVREQEALADGCQLGLEVDRV